MLPYYSDESVTLYHGDALAVLRTLPDGSVNCCVTSPPYFGLRDYGVDGQLGAEGSPAEYVANLVAVFAEVRRVLADDGTLWLNLGDSYASKPPGNVRGVSERSGLNGAASDVYRETLMAGVGTKRDTTGFGVAAKNLLGIPWRTAFALQDDGWTLRNDIIWAKPNGMPESVTDRLTTKHEHVFLFAKSRRYWFDLAPIREPLAKPDAPAGEWVFGGANKAPLADPVMRRRGATYTPNVELGRNPGDVWTIPTAPTPWAHFATMPPALAERCILAGCKPGGVVLDPFSGSGTTGYAATRHGRRYVGIDLNRDYKDLSLRTRLAQGALVDGETA
jgi:site-specific DNA-methyltransferase (cytosine-N4-specific)